MVSRVKTASSFDAQGPYGYDITNTASYNNNNILIHMIRCIQTQDGGTLDEIADEHAIMEIFDNPYETTLSVAYVDGGTTLTLTSATDFNTAGRGAINGVAFEWTGKSGNVLTVPDLDANYAVGDKVVNMSSMAPGSGSASLKLKFMINAQRRHNSAITITFPIPMLLVNGGRVHRTTDVSGPIINICYTVLDSMGDIDPLKNIFLQSYYTAGDVDDAVVEDTDVEVYGAYVNSTGTMESISTGYAGIKIKNGANSQRANVYLNEMYSREVAHGISFSGEFESLDSSAAPMWFPYPVYLKDGFIQAAAGHANGRPKLHSTSFYRKVNAKGIDHGWT